MSDKLQTVYVPTESGEIIPSDSIQLNGKDFYKKQSGYFFTPEELKERDEKRDIEMHNYYLQETQRAKADADMYKRQLDNLMTPFWKEGTF